MSASRKKELRLSLEDYNEVGLNCLKAIVLLVIEVYFESS